MSHRRPAALLLAALTLAGVAVLGGCLRLGYREGGTGFSNDQHVYVSRTWEPKSVSLVDTRSGEVLWSVDIPVGQKLAVKFHERQNSDDAIYPSIMRFQVMPETQYGGELNNSIPVPGRTARRLEVRLRPAPEYPPEAPTAAAPRG